MPDVFTKAKRSEVMSRIRGRGNKETELALMRLFRLHRITQLYSTRTSLDAIDRVEVACSLLVLQNRFGIVDEKVAIEMRKDLASLPPACAKQLTLLGVLTPHRSTKPLPKTPL